MARAPREWRPDDRRATCESCPIRPPEMTDLAGRQALVKRRKACGVRGLPADDGKDGQIFVANRIGHAPLIRFGLPILLGVVGPRKSKGHDRKSEQCRSPGKKTTRFVHDAPRRQLDFASTCSRSSGCSCMYVSNAGWLSINAWLFLTSEGFLRTCSADLPDGCRETG